MITILSQFPIIAKVLADSLTNGSIPALQKLALTGKISVKELVTAVEDGSTKIEEAFKNAPVTVASAFGVLKDALERQIGISDQASGATGRLAAAILFLAHHIDAIVNAIKFATEAFLAFRAALLIQSGLAAFSVFLTGINTALVTYTARDRKSTRLNSSHQIISYAVFCLKKKKRT